MARDWPLIRLYAYSVVPGAVVDGGTVAASNEMHTALIDAHENARLDRALPVNLTVDTSTRTSVVRDRLLDLGFGTPQASVRAAEVLAGRLADVMDQRSKPCLLVVSVRGEQGGSSREVVLWTFPRDAAFRLDNRRNRVRTLDDIFSRSSKLRKAALFTGRNARAHFLGGRVLDYQANATDRFVADYWIARFLDAQLQMSSNEGTRFFATALRAANDRLIDQPTAQEQLHAAITAVRRSPRHRWSLEDFCHEYLDEPAVTAVTEAAPNADSVTALFDLDREQFDELIQFRVFRLNTGTTVSAPFAEVGDSVTIDDDGERRFLTATGEIVNERIRARGR
jgi:hypothetical protein